MPMATDLAPCSRLAAVDNVPNGPERPEVCQHRTQILVGHVAQIPPGHGTSQFSRAYLPSAHHTDEESLIVIGDPGRIWSDVRRSHLAVRKPVPTGELEASDWSAPSGYGRVTVEAL